MERDQGEGGNRFEIDVDTLGFWIFLLVVVVLFSGEPDLMDAFIHRLIGATP